MKTLVYCSAALVTIALVVYSQTLAFAWDEGFHLLAARLIEAGKRPYVDFIFAQPPLNAYWNAGLLRIFGESWRAAHAVAAIETAGAVMLTTQYVFSRIGVVSIAAASVFLLGFNHIVFEYGTIGQAYGLCLLLLVAAFRLSIVAVGRATPLAAALAGLACGAAACSSLLTAPAGPVLLVWIALRNRAGHRFGKLAAFVAGFAAGLAPIVYWFARAPRIVFFDIVGFHLFYRQAGWDDWLPHDLGVVTAWLASAPAFALIALAIAGLAAAKNHPRRDEFQLCAWLAVTLTLFLTTGHPTFESYFVLAVPFVCILASAGLREIGGGRWPALILTAIIAMSLARDLSEEREDQSWKGLEKVANKVNGVTPPGAALYADEHIYFLTRRVPPPGMEWGSGHKIEMPLAKAAPLHVLPRPELDRRIAARMFATLETCDESDIHRLGLNLIYRQNADAGGCFIFWDPIAP